MEMMTLPLWLVDMEHFPGIAPLTHGAGAGGRQTWAAQDHGHLPPPQVCVWVLHQLPGPLLLSGTPQPLHPSSIVGLFQTCPLYREPLAQRVASPFS